MARIFGLDFGTTNSVAAFIQRNPDSQGHHSAVLTDSQGRPHPSVVWYQGTDVVVGRQAKDQMGQLGLGIFGDIVRSPKMFLGSPTGIHIGGVNRPATEVCADVLRFVRAEALKTNCADGEFDRAMVTVPVSMDGRARRELRQSALAAGIHVQQFVHEPLAALYGYLRARTDFSEQCARMEGRLALVFDWGGGTLDLTLCRFHHGGLVQVLNLGDPEVGGDKFDLELVRLAKRKHSLAHPEADWSKMQASSEARLIGQCEAAKIQLSDKPNAFLLVKNLLAVPGSERDLDVQFNRGDLVEVTAGLVREGLGTIDRLLDAAKVHRTAVEFCLATGGMVAMPAIREGLIQYFDAARVRTVPNAATIIAEGAAWIGHDRVRVSLAKPIEILHADDIYIPVLRAATPLPNEGEQISETMSLYCVDPRDRKAKITVARNRWPGREGPADPRVAYGCLTVGVDPTAKPLMERLRLTVSIDDNCIARVTARSELLRDTKVLEIPNLEFGLQLPVRTRGPNDEKKYDSPHEPWNSTQVAAGAIKVRSNVAQSPYAQELIPGELMSEPITLRQHDEKMYYVPCSMCGRNEYDIERFGCDRCAERGQALSPFDAERRWNDFIRDHPAERQIG